MKKLKLYFQATILTVVFVGFQNCSIPNSPYSSASFRSKQRGLAGNGDSYDGKGRYDRRIPGHTCSGERAPHSSLEFKTGANPMLVTNLDEDCGKTNPVEKDEILASKNTGLIGYKNGIYAHDMNLPEGTFVEAWCRVPDSLGDTEFVIRWEKPGDTAKAQIFNPYLWPSGSPEFEVKRTLHPETITYFGRLNDDKSMRIVINRSMSYPDSPYELAGTDSEEAAIACRLGGQFDPEAPKMSYHFMNNTFLVNQDIGLIEPQVPKKALSFSINPPLPVGLNFDPTTGGISGIPSQLTKGQIYTVTALFQFDQVSESLHLGVGRRFQVNSNADAEDSILGDGLCATSSSKCSLRAAIQEANSDPESPVIIHLPNQVFSLELGQLEIGTNIQIEAERGARIDAQSKSRHFELLPGSRVSISDIELVNGAAGASGGSILANMSSLSLHRLHFENNKTAADDSQGGAISATGSQLFVKDSTFKSNETLLSGANLRGGAIYLRNSQRVTILNSYFFGNKSASGGAIWSLGGSATIQQIKEGIFERNYAIQGGAMFLRNGSYSLENLKIKNNEAAFEGAGVIGFWYDDLWVINSEFSGNIGTRGNSLDLNGWPRSIAKILESRFLNNVRSDFALKYFPEQLGSIIRLSQFNARLRNSVFMGNDQQESCHHTFKGLIDPTHGFEDLGGNIFDQFPCEFVWKPKFDIQDPDSGS